MSDEIDNIYKFAGTIPEKIDSDCRRDLFDTLNDWGAFSTHNAKKEDTLLKQCREELIDYNEGELEEETIQIGIFKEINCLWKILNNFLELTTFDSKTGQILRQKIYREEFGSDIVSVALAPPVPNVFLEEVNYILVVATTVEIRVLAVVFNPFDAIQISPTQYYISTENVEIIKIESTKKGRIFMAGSDGNLFELVYNNEESFWSTRTKCRKLNLTQSLISSFVPSFLRLSEADSLVDICIDNDRNLLYTLSHNSKIQLYDLGVDGKSLNLVSSISNLKKTVEKIFPHATSNDSSVVSISTITKEDSHSVHLIAATLTGFRLYFSTFNDSRVPINKNYSEIGPQALKLLHVRAPYRKLNNVYASYYFPGNFCVLTDSYGLHFYWLFDSSQRKNQELKEFIPIRNIWNFAFVQGDVSKYKEVATQQRSEPTRFCFVTMDRFYFIEKIRPIDEIETATLSDLSSHYSNDELFSFLFIVGKSKNLQRKDYHPTEQINGAELYITRKLTPYWNVPIFVDIEGYWSVNPIFQSANFKDDNYQSIISKLNHYTAAEIQMKFQLLDCCREILHFSEIIIPYLNIILDDVEFTVSTISSISFARFFSDKKYLILYKELASAIISKLNEKEAEGFLLRLEKLPTLFTSFDQKYYSILEVLLQSSKRNQSDVKFALQNIISMMTSPDQCARIRSSLTKICIELFVLEYFDGIIDLILALCHTIDPHKYSHKYFDSETNNDHLVKDIFHQLEEFYQLLIAVLSKLYEQNSKYFAQVLHKMLSVDELPLSYLVFHWLIKTNLMEQLFANENSYKIPHLENFLICYHPELLETFYNANNQFEKTAQYFFDAFQRNIDDPLTERIKYLEQSLKAAILANSNLEIIIQQYLRVASIQLEIFDILDRNRDKIRIDSSHLLNSNLSISDLYHNYALPYQLSAIQLKIIRVNDVADETTRATVKDIWHFILKHFNSTPPNGLQLFNSNYVLETINQLYPSPTTLPLDEICFYRFKKIEIEKDFIENVLIRSNVPFEEIFRLYHQKTMRTENPRMIYYLMSSQIDKPEKLIPFRTHIKQYKELCKDDKDLYQKFVQLDQHIQSIFA